MSEIIWAIRRPGHHMYEYGTVLFSYEYKGYTV